MSGITRVLIANRGEIAVRVIRTCRRLGMETIAVYSEADREAPYVRLAGEAVAIGPAEAARSYLRADALIDAALRHGADAIHPGYGFLAESADFARRCEEAGLTFVGPSSECLRRAASKIAARALAEAAGLPCVPGYHGDDQGSERLRREAARIGFPVMVKSAGAGGGRGMRMVSQAEDLDAAVEAARREAVAACGDGTLLLERWLPAPRHVEVQLAGDRQGHLVHLFERACSIQRRHQKIIEEAPAAGLSADLLACLHQAALAFGRAVGYDSVGTVEFLLEPETAGGAFYFLEMNPRLQVEHPVTELVTGLDLVELQLRAAGGCPLGLSQGAVALRGVAIEARVCAEDPAQDYRPETGTVRIYRPPELPNVRLESGVEAGTVVTPHYDSLLAKVIAWGEDRETARRRLRRALGDFALAGVQTNLAFLRQLLDAPAFSAGALTTDYVTRAIPSGALTVEADREDFAVVGALYLATLERSRGTGPWASLGGWRLARRGGGPRSTRLLLSQGDGAAQPVELSGTGGCYSAGGGIGEVRIGPRRGDEYPVEIAGRTRTVLASLTAWGEEIAFHAEGKNLLFRVHDQLASRGSPDAPAVRQTELRAPLPGLVAEVPARLGARVVRGEVLVLMDAMKLTHALSASASGLVRALHCRPGTTVAKGQLLLEMEPDHAGPEGNGP